MSQQRQLAAIMFTDIEGYTALMHSDEKEGVELRKQHREVFEKSTERHNGKVIQYFGDGTLSIFKSTVEAVDCAIEMQQLFSIDPKIPVRIGIHVGDIVYSKDDIIGDAVNIASRIESGAISGSILISDKVHDQIRSHRHIQSRFLDAYTFKNVDDAMPLFAISNEGLQIPSKDEVKSRLKGTNDYKHKKNPLRIKNIIIVAIIIAALIFSYFNFINPAHKVEDYSLAVLPFKNLSVDDDAEIFGDGLNQDILTQLSKLKGLHIISRKSVNQFKNTQKSISEIAGQLGVAYILQGSIRKNDDRVRVSVQLIYAKTGEQISAEQYDKTITDIFEIQTEVSKEIVDALNINITFEEQQSLTVIPTKNIEAYQNFLRGRQEADKRNKESIARSIELYQQAISLDPNYAEAYAEIANSIYLETYYSGRDPVEASESANEYLDKAESINDKVSRIYSVRGLIYNIEGKHELADESFKKALRLSPNDLTARHQYSTFFYYSQKYEKQLEQAEIAFKLDPLSFATANSYFMALTANLKYDEAEQLMKRVELNSDNNNKFVINRSYFRLYYDKSDYKSSIRPLLEMVSEEPVYYRFLGYSYAMIGDTLNAYNVIDSIRLRSLPKEKDYLIALVYAGLKEPDSVIQYLRSIPQNQIRILNRERSFFHESFKNDTRFDSVLKAKGLNE